MNEIIKSTELTEKKSELSKGFTAIEPNNVLSSNDITDLVHSEFDRSKTDLTNEIYGRSEDEIRIDHTFSENLLDVLDRFESENWDRLSEAEKYDAVAELIEAIGNELELPEIPYMYLVDREESYYGSYAPGTNTITINQNGFSDPKELVDTVAHELRHVYQEYRAEVLETREDALFRESLDNYISAEYDSQGNCINFDEYSGQYVEADARAFANKVTDAM